LGEHNPVPEGTNARSEADAVAYNAVAKKVMDENQILSMTYTPSWKRTWIKSKDGNIRKTYTLERKAPWNGSASRQVYSSSLGK